MSSNPPSNLYTGDTIDKANIGHPTQQQAQQQFQPPPSSSSSGAQSSSQLTSSSAPSSSIGKEKEKEKEKETEKHQHEHPPVMTDMSRKEEQHRSSGWGAPASRRLMVFVDGSPESDRAFYTALTWLREGDFLSSVYVVDAMTLHPIPAGRIALFGSAAPGAEEAAKSAREKVHRLIARYAAMAREVNAHNVQCVAVSTAADRSVKEEALHYAQQLKADVIFTGTRGQGAVKRFFLGSFANYLLNNSECDVMIVKGELHLGVPSHQARITAEAAHRALHERGGVYHGFAGYSYEESPSTGSRIPPPHGVVFGSGKQDPEQDKSTHEETTPSKSKAGEALPGTTQSGEKSFSGPHKGLGMEGDKGIKGPSSEEVSRMEKTAVQIAGDKVPGFDKVPGIAPPHKAMPNPCDTAPEHHHGGGGGGRPNSPH